MDLIRPVSRILAALALTSVLQSQDFARSKLAIETQLRAISTQPVASNLGSLAGERSRALQRLQAYRYLSAVEWRGMRTSERLNSLADAAALLCQAAGRIAHELPNPGLSAGEYSRGLIGIRGSNLAFAYPKIDLSRAVDGFIDDSDGANIEQLGHRAWCLNPELKVLGFGRRGRYAAMMCRDQSGRRDGIDYVCYPGPGYYPLSYFAASRPWSINFDWRKYSRSALARAELKFYRLDAKFMDAEELSLQSLSVSDQGMGLGYSLIFRPAGLELSEGASYRIFLRIPRAGRGDPEEINYMVSFFALQAKSGEPSVDQKVQPTPASKKSEGSSWPLELPVGPGNLLSPKSTPPTRPKIDRFSSKR